MSTATADSTVPPTPRPGIANLLAHHGPLWACALAGIAVSVYYAWQVFAHGAGFGFPLDDSYIYMTYAKQIARGRPFTYFDGSGYTAGATSMLWPVLIAPLWAVGIRGHAFAVAIFALCSLLLAATAVLALRLGTRTIGTLGGAVAGLWLVVCAPLTWSYLSGMEVALAGTLILASAAVLARHEGTPSRRLVLLLALTAIARPEAGLLVGVVLLGCAVAAARGRQWRCALLWCLPMVLPVSLALMNKILAGHFTPNTAVAKSHFYLPGFDWTYYANVLWTQTGALVRGLFLLPERSPLTWAPALLLLWIVGAIRLLLWARRERRYAAAFMLVLGAPILFAAIIASSGRWSFQNYRYIATGLPALFVVAGIALNPPLRLQRLPRWVGSAYAIAVAVIALIGAVQALPRLHADTLLYAQGARDHNAQVVRIGRWIHDNLPADAHVAIHDVGAIGYDANRQLTDIIGLITNHQAHVCNQGPGARFESLERLPAAQRPTHFAYYSGWLINGSRDLYGKSLFQATVPRPLLRDRRLVGGHKMEVLEADWSVANSGDEPLSAHQGWHIVDVVDVADLVSEREHDYSADMKRRRFGDSTDRWSMYFSAVHGGRRIGDGGRAIRGPGGERFTITADPDKPLRLVLRTGAPASYVQSRVPARPAPLIVRRGDTGAELGRFVPPRPDAQFHDLVLEVPPGSRPRRLPIEVTPERPQTYRAFHYFVLQPR